MHRARFVHTAIYLTLFLCAFVASAIFVRTFVIGTSVVDGLSMYPTFSDNQRLVVSKLPLLFRAPRRGDIVQIAYRPNAQLLVKRIIGLPGETIRIRKNAVFLVHDDGSEEALSESYLANGTLTRAWDNKPATYGPLGPHEYFVLGDNRMHSRADSRLLGPIPRQWMYGLAYRLF